MVSLDHEDEGTYDLEAVNHIAIHFVHWDVVPTSRRTAYEGRLLKNDALGHIHYAMPSQGVDYADAMASGRMTLCIECIGVSMVRTTTLSLMSEVPPAVIWQICFLEHVTAGVPEDAADEAFQQVEDPCVVCGRRPPARRRCPLCLCASHPSCLDVGAPTPAHAAAVGAALQVSVGPVVRPDADVPIWCELIAESINCCCAWRRRSRSHTERYTKRGHIRAKTRCLAWTSSCVIARRISGRCGMSRCRIRSEKDSKLRRFSQAK